MSQEDEAQVSARDTRIEHLEDAEIERDARRRLDHRFELFEAIVLSIAAVLAAWTGFQSAKWSGVQANSYSVAGATRVESTRASTLAGQESTADLVSFTSWLQAAENEGLLADLSATDDGYTPDPTLVSGFLYERFRPEFKVAVDAWVATRPGTNADAPATPFAMKEYRLAATAQADRLERKAERSASEARTANQRSDNYVLMTIVFATVLFFAGISSKMDTVRARTFLLSVGVLILFTAMVIVATFPKEI
jgi:hypothetical protein